MNQFFIASTDPYIKNVFKKMIEKNIEEQARSYELKSWRECAGMFVT